ncbi:MAG: GNAT family N-acetyltransferase [Anaerolineae bacterium]|jgi:GNAT superfamily N-acetyltransferase|nr:GNAT family N-acetyltransferase [Anaerolineae bacterium]
MHPDELLSLFDRQVRFEAEDPLSDRQESPGVVRIAPLDEGARWGWVIWSDLTEANADAAIRAQVDYFVARGQNFEWKLFAHDRPADLGARLLRHRFVEGESETVMALDLRDHADLGGPAPHDVRKVTDDAALREVARLETTIWGNPHNWIVTELGAELLLPGEPTVMYLAYIDGQPAAAAWIRFYEGTQFAALFGGSTLPEYRERGLYTALLQVRAAEARRRGYRFLTVDAGEMSRPILEKRGFIALTTATEYKYYVGQKRD